MQTRQRSLFLLGVMLLSLTLVFVFDDVLFYLLFERLLGWQLSVLAKIGIGVVILALNLGLAIVVLKALDEKPQTGSESMIGEQGMVESISPPYYWVKVHGELWRARASEMLAVGDKVVVQKLAGLTLEVARAQTPASRGNGGEA